MKLDELIRVLPGAAVSGPADIPVTAVTADSRTVRPGGVFVAVRGYAVDGNRFSAAAAAAGAGAVVTDDAGAPVPAGVTCIRVADARLALALLAGRICGEPAARLRMTGITGTNGKTSVSYLIRAILEAAGVRTGVIGTIGYDTGTAVLPAERTTPEAPELHRYLADMLAGGCGAAVMEVSSHSLALERVAGIRFGCAVFTNLSRDHLDYHGTEEAYGTAKMRLFSELVDGSSSAVVNLDDAWGARMAAATPARVISYAVNREAALRARGVRLGIDGTSFTLCADGKEYPVRLRLLGMFNVYNALAALGGALGNGVDIAAAVAALEGFPGVKGRFEPVATGRGFAAVVDYAHTPDALEKVLAAARAVCAGRIITVMGCGGDRDRGKRPRMGEAAVRLSDLTVVTSDNPRTEDPDVIIADILTGISSMETVTVEPDRRAAIGLALAAARPGDMVVVAGKGHEDYQIIGTQKHHFDDRETVESLLAGVH